MVHYHQSASLELAQQCRLITPPYWYNGAAAFAAVHKGVMARRICYDGSSLLVVGPHLSWQLRKNGLLSLRLSAAALNASSPMSRTAAISKFTATA